jgi:hypothetical protein
MGMVSLEITNNVFIPWIFLPFSGANKYGHVDRTPIMMIKLDIMPRTCVLFKNIKASWGPNDCIPIKE